MNRRGTLDFNTVGQTSCVLLWVNWINSDQSCLKVGWSCASIRLERVRRALGIYSYDIMYE